MSQAVEQAGIFVHGDRVVIRDTVTGMIVRLRALKVGVDLLALVDEDDWSVPFVEPLVEIPRLTKSLTSRYPGGTLLVYPDRWGLDIPTAGSHSKAR